MDPRRMYWHASQPHSSYSHPHSNSPSPQSSPHHQPSNATWSHPNLNWQQQGSNGHNSSSSSSNNDNNNQHYSTATHSAHHSPRSHSPRSHTPLPPLANPQPYPHSQSHSQPYPVHQLQHLYHASSSSSSSSAPNSHSSGVHYSYVPASAPGRAASDPSSASRDGQVADSATDETRPKRKQVKNACQSCQKACKRCDSGRPCARCVKYGIQDTCRDSIRKGRKKGFKRGPYRRNPKKEETAERTAHPRPSWIAPQTITPKVEESYDSDYSNHSISPHSISPRQHSFNLESSNHYHHQQQQQQQQQHQHQDSNGSFSPMSAPASVQKFSVNMAFNSPADRAIYDRMSFRDYGSGNLNGPGSSSALGLHHSQSHPASASSSPSLGAHAVPNSTSLMAHAHPLPHQTSLNGGNWGSHDRSVSMPAVPHSAPLLSPRSLHARFPLSGSSGYGQHQQLQNHSQPLQSNPVLPSLSAGASNGGWPSSSLFSASHPSNAAMFHSQHQQQSPSPHAQQSGFGNGINLYSSSPLNHNGPGLSTSSGSFFPGSVHARLASEPTFYSSSSQASPALNHANFSSSNRGASSSASNSVPPLSAHSNSSNSNNSNGSLSPRTPIQGLPNASPSSTDLHPLHVHSRAQALGNEVVPAIGGPKPFVLKLGNQAIRNRSSTHDSNGSTVSLVEGA